MSVPPDESKPPTVLEVLAEPNDPIFADSQGSNEVLSSGNRLLGYGIIAVLRDLGPRDSDNVSSELRLTARFGADSLVQSYRGFKQERHAVPSTTLSLAIERNGTAACGTGYVSWKGAIDVDTWLVLQGRTREAGPCGRDPI